MVRFPTEETKKGQDDMITWGEPYVEALRMGLSAKKKQQQLQNGETVYMTFYKFWIVDATYLITDQLNWSHTQFVCAWIGNAHSVYVSIMKETIITVIIN